MGSGHHSQPNYSKVVMPGGVVAPGDDSIDDLRMLAVTERPEAMGKILNQHQSQQLCFMNFLMMTQNSHPATFFAMKLAARVGEVVMMRLKRKYLQSAAFTILSGSVPAGRCAWSRGLSGRPRADRARDRQGSDRSDDPNRGEFTLREITPQIGRPNRFQ